MIGQLKAVPGQFCQIAAQHQQGDSGHGTGCGESRLFNQFIGGEGALAQRVEQSQLIVSELVAQGF